MGLCTSCDAATPVATAKVILHDGRLQEYAYPVKVSYVLQRTADVPDFFICNSDEMEFDDVVSAVDADEELQPGQLYFALPLSNLRRPLLPEEMAALAVKANVALTKSGNDKCRHRSNLVFAEKDLKSAESKAAVAGRKGRRNVDGGGGRSKRKDFAAKLSAIPE